MANEEYIEECLNRAQQKVDRALTELMEVKMVRENDPTEYAFAQKELNEVQSEIDTLINEEHSNNAQLLEAQKRLNEVREIMIKGI
jgi:predicted transcriptional regulator